MLSPNGVRAILFDWDGTLRQNHPSSEHTFFDFAAQLGLPDSPERRQAAMRWTHQYWAQSADLLQDIQDYGGEGEEFWINYARRHLESFECSPEQAGEMAHEVHQLMRSNHKPVDRVIPGTVQTLHVLKEAGFMLAIVSNRGEPFIEQVEKLELLPFFDCVLAAGEVSSWKPEPEIFLHALDRLGAQPGEALYVGDNYYADVLGARKAGLKPVLLDQEGIFQGADCPVIHSLPELVDLLEKPAQS